jgi:O-antigen ligase
MKNVIYNLSKYHPLNSQIVSIHQVARSKNTFYILTTLIPLSLFFTSGFVSVSIIWFFALCVYNYLSPLGDRLKTYRILLFPIALFAVNLPWLVLPDDMPTALTLILRKIHLFLIPFGFMVVTSKVSEKGLNIILALFLLVCLIASFICLAVATFNMVRHQSLADFGVNPEGYYFTYYRLTQPLDIAPVYLSLFCNFAFLIGLHSPFIHSLAKKFVALYLGFFIILISSAIGIVTLVVISLLWLWRSGYKHFTTYAAGGILISALIFAFYCFPLLQGQFVPDYREQPEALVTAMPSRLAIWSSAWKAIKQRPIIGYGPGGGQKALEEVYEKENFSSGIDQTLNPHNEFLSTYLDLGVVGFSLLLAGLVYPLFLSIRMNDGLSMSFIVIIFLFFCFESVLVRQKGIVFFSFFYSLIYCRLSTGKDFEARSDNTGLDRRNQKKSL